VFLSNESNKWDIKILRVFQIGTDKRDYLMNHLPGWVYGKSILFNPTPFPRITGCEFCEKHMVKSKIKVEDS